MKRTLLYLIIGIILLCGLNNAVSFELEDYNILQKNNTKNFLPHNLNDSYDMVIITPIKFAFETKPLVQHKLTFGIKTTLKTTEDIYIEYDGRDQAEKIKYYIKDAVENHNISYELVSKVLQNLTKNEIIVSFQGVKGGYSLKKNPLEISLIDLIKAVEPEYQITNCLKIDSVKSDCEHSDCCKIKDPLAEVQKKIDKVFFETKLAYII